MTKFQPKPAILTAQELAKVGELLYGRQWQSALAEALGMSLRNIQYLAAGSRPVHEGIASDVYDLLAPRELELARAKEVIAHRLAGRSGQTGGEGD